MKGQHRKKDRAATAQELKNENEKVESPVIEKDNGKASTKENDESGEKPVNDSLPMDESSQSSEEDPQQPTDPLLSLGIPDGLSAGVENNPISFPVVTALRTLYVDAATGDDANTGLAENDAFLTVAKAATVAVAGDEVVVKPGTYRELATLANSGTQQNPVIFTGENIDTTIVTGSDVVTDWISAATIEDSDIWADGFEGADFSSWTTVTVAGTNTFTLDTTEKKNGNASARLVADGTNSNNYSRFDLPSPETSVFVRFWVRLDAGFDLQAGSRMDLLKLIDSNSSETLLRVGLAKDGANLILHGRILSGTDQTFCDNPADACRANPLTTGQWHRVVAELQTKSATASASITLYDNTGAQVFTISSGATANQALNDVRSLRLGFQGPAIPVATSALNLDSVSLATTDPGDFTPIGSASTYRASVSWTGRQAFANDARLSPEDDVASCDAQAGSFYLDATNDFMYVRLADDSNPNSATMEVSRRNSGFDLGAQNFVFLRNMTLEKGNNTSYGLVHIDGGSDNLIFGNKLNDGYGSGVLLENNGRRNRIIGNNMKDNQRAFGGGVRGNGTSELDVSWNSITSSGGSGIVINCGSGGHVCEDNLLSHNHIYDVYDTGIYLNEDAGDTLIYRNIIHGSQHWATGGGNGIHLGTGSSNNTVVENLVYNVNTHCFGAREGASNNIFYKNTAVDCGQKGNGDGFNSHVSTALPSIGNTYYGNVVSNPISACFNFDQVDVGDGTTSFNLNNCHENNVALGWGDTDYNSLVDWIPDYGDSSSSLWDIDPVFLDPSAKSYQMDATSPLRGVLPSLKLSDIYPQLAPEL